MTIEKSPPIRFDVITIFEQMFEPFTSNGIVSRAYQKNLLQLHCHNPRNWAEDNYKRIDERPFGGGPGMIMLAQPLYLALNHSKIQREKAGYKPNPPVILFSPAGEKLSHQKAEELSQGEGVIMICGRYEGIDQRFINQYITHQISIGDFILSGGEIAAIATIDAAARLISGVLNHDGSHQQDSFNPAIDGLLDCPHYTRPQNWQGEEVPEVLTSGNHEKIAKWRRKQSLAITQKNRPDLIKKARQKELLTKTDEKYLIQIKHENK